jgi:anti-sigma regulatory factor (Ser/Thr protein kinase)/predicted transcriptional regulator
MKYTTEKKQTVILYILEKITEGTQNISKTVSETFNISPNTVHTYLNELIESNIIKKEKRGKYKLISTIDEYNFNRGEGKLASDTLPYDICLEKKIKHLNQNIQRIWLYGLSEMVNNVIDHSNAENMKLIVIQSYLTTSVLLIDDGVGIFEKIKKHFNLSDLDEAICELFKGKLTTDAENHSGEGIFFTSKMMDSFLIFSDGKIFTSSKFENDTILDTNKIIQGTCVYMSLSNFTHKTTKEIFDQYSDIDGGFNTTKIPLKNIFDGAPVSRSQAKRVCNRLEQFTEAILDFDGIEWMGQGFAHQIFIVFKNAHPDISIVPQNMNDSVASMYNHVIKTN